MLSGAIKFGDQLTLEECNFYVNQLSKCKLPFQCAHGRPTVAPCIVLKPPRNKVNNETLQLNITIIICFRSMP